MIFPSHFIAATTAYSTLTDSVPAPYFRKSFTLEQKPDNAELIVCGLGFYELFINGQRITKGKLAPYISAPNDLIYYDVYDLSTQLIIGKNVIGICLGNGMQNCSGGYPWDFDKVRWRGAPKVSLRLEAAFHNADSIVIESDTSFKTSASPIIYDDLRNGEYYDARKETPDWGSADFDDQKWSNAIEAPTPAGDPILCQAEPIVITREIKPVWITAQDDGYLYDFGENCAGVCRLQISGGTVGQTILLYYGECLKDGKLYRRNICFDENDYVQKDIYISKGAETETYTPSFTYHGFQYVFIKGLTSRQATPEALTYLVMNSDLPERGGFICSDETVNMLQSMTRRSTLANFYYFPTDCPQREKNGWTADAALSAEHTLLNFGPENSYREWLHNICKAQNDKGALPGIVPTGGWGFQWGNGPAWDCVLIYLPYYSYVYRGDKTILEENAHAILRYLDYLTTVIREDGLICIGLGDWCPVGRNADQYKSPLEFTDTVISMDICQKAAFIFQVLQKPLQCQFAMDLYQRLRIASRNKLLNLDTMIAAGNCQTSQSMAIFYSLFESGEKKAAFDQLVKMIEQNDCLMDVGVLGARVLFHVLSDFGRSDLALKMIVTPKFPSYGNWVKRGATSLWEDFLPEGGNINSLNHHFWGDISHWFYRHLAGICFNPHGNNLNEVDICPSFVESLQYAEGYHLAPMGKIHVRWERKEQGVLLQVDVPPDMIGYIRLESGYRFEDGSLEKEVAAGEYVLVNS